MKHLAYLLLWLSVLTFGHAAHATEADFLTATPTAVLPENGINAPIGAQDNENNTPPAPPPAAIPAETTLVANAAEAERSLSSNPPAQTAAGTSSGGALNFALSPTSGTAAGSDAAMATAAAPASAPPTTPNTPAITLTAAPALDALFAGNENSLVAKAVGSAEGTRTPDGTRNPAYYGHTDPGNGVWNLGSFSYQHAAASPEDADAKQLARLRRQADQILQKASDKGFSLTLTEKLNGIDLANQAPLAALGQQGYIDWLAVAKSEGKPETDAVLSARVRSFINPQTQRWDAPGLGNSEARITQDQARRMQAIERAILANQQQIAQMQPSSGEDQLLSQQSESLFTGVKPTLEKTTPEQLTPERETPEARDTATQETTAESTAKGETIAEAPNTDDILNLNL
jgi:hypothetical protein